MSNLVGGIMGIVLLCGAIFGGWFQTVHEYAVGGLLLSVAILWLP